MMLNQFIYRFKILLTFVALFIASLSVQATDNSSLEHKNSNNTYTNSMFFQGTSEVIVSVRWRRWSSDNKVDVFDPAGTLLTSICNPNSCYNAATNNFYTTEENLGCLPDGAGYYIIMYDAYGDGWNGNGSYVRVSTGGTTVINHSGSGTNSSGTTVGFSVSGGGAGCATITPTITDLDLDNDGIPNAVECPAQYTYYIVEDFSTVPNTDLVPDGFGSCVSPAGDNPDDAGTYILTDITNSTLNGVWQTPSGTIGNPSAVASDINTPTGNFMLINSFGSTAGALNQCQDLSSDHNGNGQGGEMVIFSSNAVPAGEYLLSVFFAELTNTDPHVGSYSFVIKDASTGALLGNIAATTLPKNGGTNSPWFYNTGEFTLNATTDLDIILLQTQGEDGGADIAIDNFALYGIGCRDSDGDGIADDMDLDSDNDGIADIIEAGGVDTNNDGQVDYATPGDPSTMVDVDGDGLADIVDNIDSGNGGGEVTSGTPLAVPNTDGTGQSDYVDIDADDDGIVDNTEAQTTNGYIAPTGYDDDGDGLDNAYDVDCTGNCTAADGVTTNVTGAPIVPVNTENDGGADYVDTDTDNDNILDEIEGHDTNADGVVDGNDTPVANTGLAGGTADIDQDGLLDGFDNDLSSKDPTNTNLNGESYPDVAPGVSDEQDWREMILDPCAGPTDPNVNFDRSVNIGIDDVSDTWAATWADYDNDGLVDLFVTNYSETVPNYLYKNNGDRTFTKITTGDIVTDLASSLAATWGDYDNDGDLDLFVANNIGYENFLYRNNGGTFTRILSDPIVTDKGYAHGASWADYDNDGFLDLFVADYFATKFNHLYHNNGDGTFAKVTTASPVLEASASISGAWGDYNNDGLPDLFVANNAMGNNSLYKNTGNGNFLKINTGAIVNDAGSSVGASWGDYDNDGDLDLFVSNSGNQNNFLYQNNGDETFTKINSGSIVTDGGHSHGSAWADYDNDGDLDLFVANDQGQDNFLYANNGDGTFTSIVNDLTQNSANSFGSAWADYDNDGDLDLLVTNHDMNENFIFQNLKGTCESKACITLEGTNSNSSAIGTKIYLKANIDGQDVWQMREISAQTGGGIGGQSELKTIIGTGDATVIDSIIVEWSSGYRQILTNQPLDVCFTITEENASEICGVAYFDENGNCTQDGTETGIPNMELIIQPGNRSVVTNDQGEYSILVEPGNYTIEENATGTNWASTCTTQHSVNVSGIGGTFCGNNFANAASCALPDLAVDISATIHRVGFENLIALTYSNNGTQTATNVNLTVQFGTDVIPLESSIPWTSESGTDKSWKLGDVAMGTSVTIYIKDSVSTDAIVGEDIKLIANIDGDQDDCNTADDLVIDVQPAVGAVDPNDILVSPEGYISKEEELTYKIRFQNVGNARVSNVSIENQLPENLDVNTLELGAASHNYRFEIQDGNRLVWSFENINMPDSLTNEPESHGFVTYKIYPKAGLKNGNEIENTASIFFDNMDAIITNTVVNIIGFPNGAIAEAGQLQIVPNPMSEAATLRIVPFTGPDVNIQSVYVFDLLGRKLFSEVGTAIERFELQRGALLPGYYMVQAIGDDGKEYTGKIIVR